MKARNLLLALPLALLPSAGFAQFQPAPLSKAEILGRLALGQSPSNLAHSVKSRGIDFAISADFLSGVKLGGGDGILAERLSASDTSDFSHPVSDGDAPYDHLAKCATFLHTGDTEQADRECRASIDENPESAWPILAAVRVMEETNAPMEERAELLRHAVAVAPNLAEAHLALASALPPGEESVAETRKGNELRNPDPVENMRQPSGFFPGPYTGAMRPPVNGTSSGDGSQMDAELQGLLKMDPDLASAHLFLANYYLQRGKLEKCASELKEAVRLEPGNPEVHAFFAELYASQKNDEGAIGELRETVRIVPYGFEQRQALTQVLERQGRTDEAIREWRDLLALSPRDVQASETLVEAYIGQKDRKSAIEELRRSLKASSTAIGDDAKYANERIQDIDHLAHLLTDNKEYDAAAEQYAFLLRFQPDSAVLHNNHGNVLYAERHLDEAIMEYREALRLDANLSDAHHNLANCLMLKNKADEAVTEYQQSAQLDPNKFASRIMVGVALTQKGDFSGAIDQFQQLLLEKPEDPDIHAGLGHAFYLNNDIPSAVVELKHSLEIRPDAAVVENELAWIYATSTEPAYRKPKEALKLAKHAVEASKETIPAIIDTLAEAELINGHPQEALRTEEMAVKLAPGDEQMQTRLKHFQEAAQPAMQQANSAKP
ncbi:MAG: tetratricopeptide repeat protein [Candidatus Acidiferrum sp.]